MCRIRTPACAISPATAPLSPNIIFNLENRMNQSSSRRLVYILNPAAGKGKYLPQARKDAIAAGADCIHVTERPGDCPEFIAQTCLRDPDTHFVVYGGDGTISEAASGILLAGAGERARMSAVACGSGNDFLRGITAFAKAHPSEEESIPVDLIQGNGRYAINILNIGFDCQVVHETERIRRNRSVSNSFSYILGVGSVLMHKTSFATKIRFFDVQTPGSGLLTDETDEDEYLLTAIGNLPYYGGGFCALPAANPTDGFMDVLTVRNISTAKFLSMVGAYRKGKHVNAETCVPYPQFREIVRYRRCRRIEVEHAGAVCLDGEVHEAISVRAEVIPHAIRYIPYPPHR